MQKTLRSLIHEKIPPELRFQLELLSRKRNLINEEKHQKIIELFREFNVPDVVLLGPGTNRYAIKLDGYVVKIATDHDGKVDNLKEFKMAKRLYPYVTKTYEVSENGTLLVAEYISPFSSYVEMSERAAQIREILTKLSSTYLIGDVGITSKNYANWGLRAGSDQPVCLDFAYVYEVSSELFVCRECNTGSMLMPNTDFTKLNCSNPACGKEYSFEDIRAKIGNDIHRHEIGDLKEEGYYLTESNVVTELSEQRSNYLASKKPKVEQKVEQPKNIESQEEDFVMMNPNMDGKRMIAEQMAKARRFDIPIRATAVAVNPTSVPKNTIRAVAVPVEEEGLAFQGSIKNDTPIFTATAVPVNKPEVIQAPAVVVEEPVEEVVEAPVINDVAEDPEEQVVNVAPIIKATAVAAPENVAVEDESDTIGDNEPKATDVINDWYMKNMKRAVSKISNRISNCLYKASQFTDVRDQIKNIKDPEKYYKMVQNAVFRSLVIFCNFTTVPDTNSKPHQGKNYHKDFIPPEEVLGTPYEPTMIFLARVWNNREIYSVEDPDMMDAYRKMFSDYVGIQREWLPVLHERMVSKMHISDHVADRIIKDIAEVWCVPETEAVPVQDETEPEEMVTATVQVATADQVNANGRMYPEEVIKETMVPQEDVSPVDAAEAFMESAEEDVVFSGSTGVDIVQSPVEDHEEQDYSDEEGMDDEDQEFLTIEIYHRDEFDCIKICTNDCVGPVTIPFYCDLDNVKGNDMIPSIADDRNGIWDWLIHFVPDLMFTTKNPERWLDFNNAEPEIDQPHVVIMDEDDGVYTMAVHYIKGIFDIDDDGQMVAVFDEELLKKINNIVRMDIGNGKVSHLRSSLMMDDFIFTEEEVMKMLHIEDLEDDPDDESSEEIPEAEEPESEAEAAAIAAMMDTPEPTAPQVDIPEEDATIEAAPEEVAAPTPFRTDSGDGHLGLDDAGAEEVPQGEESEAEAEEIVTMGGRGGSETEQKAPEQMIFKPIRRNSSN